MDTVGVLLVVPSPGALKYWNRHLSFPHGPAAELTLLIPLTTAPSYTWNPINLYHPLFQHIHVWKPFHSTGRTVFLLVFLVVCICCLWWLFLENFIFLFIFVAFLSFSSSAISSHQGDKCKLVKEVALPSCQIPCSSFL